MRTTRLTALALVLLGCPAEEPEEQLPDTDTAISITASTTVGTTGMGSSGTTDDPGTTTTGEDGSSESGPPLDACGVGRICLGPPPVGWAGPLTLAKADDPKMLPTCIEPYPGNEITRYEGYVDPGPAQCECSCAINPASCQNYAYMGDNTTCYTYNMVATEGCNQLSHPVNNGNLYLYSYAMGTACDQAANEMIPEIPWSAIVKGCTGGYSDESCDDADGICYGRPAEGFEQQVCYLAQGDLPCPADTDFQDKTVRYSAVDDTRACTDCTCGALSYCLDTFDYYTSNDCSGTAAGTVTGVSCQTGITASSVEFDFDGVSCPVTSMSEAEGTVMPLDPWTYCCATL